MVKVIIEFDLDKAKDRRVYRRVTKSLTPYRGKEKGGWREKKYATELRERGDLKSVKA